MKLGEDRSETDGPSALTFHLSSCPTTLWACLKGPRNEIYTCPRVFGVQEFDGDVPLSWFRHPGVLFRLQNILQSKVPEWQADLSVYYWSVSWFWGFCALSFDWWWSRAAQIIIASAIPMAAQNSILHLHHLPQGFWEAYTPSRACLYMYNDFPKSIWWFPKYWWRSATPSPPAPPKPIHALWTQFWAKLHEPGLEISGIMATIWFWNNLTNSYIIGRTEPMLPPYPPPKPE